MISAEEFSKYYLQHNECYTLIVILLDTLRYITYN